MIYGIELVVVIAVVVSHVMCAYCSSRHGRWSSWLLLQVRRSRVVGTFRGALVRGPLIISLYVLI